MANYSPLRYPGGKAKLYNKIQAMIEENNLRGCIYAEAFAGGAGLALNLLIKGDVSYLLLNDVDRSIYAFWYSCLNFKDEFVELIRSTPIDMVTWNKIKEVQKNKEHASLLELGFSTFYLNRTNRSGIIKAGVMGGKNQSGNYKMDCRFNKENLISRIELIYEYRDRIELFNLDAIDFIQNHLVNLPINSFVFFDPPYYHKADGLYTNYYEHHDHEVLRDTIMNEMRTPYIITYDNADEIIDLYNNFITQDYEISYCASVKRTEKEIMVTNYF